MTKPNKILDLYIRYTGLGDSLFHSHIPKLAKAKGYKIVNVYVDESIIESEKTELIWRENPFVDNILINKNKYQSVTGVRNGIPLLDSIAMDMGLADKIENFEPEIYFCPTKNYNDLVVYDGNFITGAGFIDRKVIDKTLEYENNLIYLQPLSKRYIKPNLEPVEYLKTTSLKEYFNLVATAHKFYCLVSGGASLRPAFNKTATVFYGIGQCSEHRHSKLNNYINSAGKYSIIDNNIGNQFYRILRKLKINRT